MDVHTNSRESSVKNVYSSTVNIMMLCIFLYRCVSLGYFVMGLVWKLHTGVIDESWIRILNRLWIGNLRLGATINGLVLSSVCLFPLTIVSVSFGLIGMFCRKRTFLVLYMMFLLLYIVTDMIYISFLAILLHNMKSSSLALGFQDLYSSAMLQINYGDVHGSRTDWLKMFKTLGCCGVTSATNRYSVCSGSEAKNACWEKFSDTMTTYCSSYMTLASLSFILQIIQLSFCDVIYSRLSGKKLPFALARSCIGHVQTSWKRSWHLTLINTCRLLSCISATTLVLLGSILLRDDRMTGYFVHPIYSILYVFGVNFTDIVMWFGIIMIVIGVTELIFSIVAMVLDAKMSEKRSRHILFVVIYVIMLIPKILWLAVCTTLISKMREDMRSKMEYSLRHNYQNIRRSWMYLFGELECCGVSSSGDICTYGITSSCSLYPYTCFFSLYETGDYHIESNHEVSYITTNLRKMGCLEKILDIFQFYSIGFFVTIAFTIGLGGLVILLTLIRLKYIYSSENNNDLLREEDKLVKHDEKKLRKKFQNYCKSDYSRVIILITSILCVVFGLVLVSEGVVFAFDKIFNHKIIKQALFSNLKFEGVSFNQIRESLYVFMIAMGTALIIFCGFGYFTLGTRSRSLHVSQAVIVSITLVLMITGVCLWGKTKDSISYQMDIQMLEHASTFHYYDYLFIDNPDGISAWSNLFAEAECCGVNVHDRMEFILGSGQKIPLYCCKENPLTEPSKTSNAACTNALEPDLQYNMSCKDAILTRLDAYSNTFFSFSGLIIPCLIAHLSVIVYRLCRKTYSLHQNDRELIRWRTSFLSLVMLSSISMVVLGVLLKEDNTMTGTAVYNIYQYLYFQGANYNDILETMYLSLIILGVASFFCSILGFSELFKTMRKEVKLKIYIALLAMLISTKLVCVFLMIPIHAEMDTYSNNTNYQLVNMDRQYSNGYHNFSFHQLNRFYLELDCCGSTGTYGFWKLVNSAGYGPISGTHPAICCDTYPYDGSNSFSSSSYSPFCEKMACGEKLFSVVNFYNKGSMSAMSITALFEILCLILALRYLYNHRQNKRRTLTYSLKKKLSRYPKSQHLGMVCAVLMMTLSIGFLAQSAAFRYDEIFANKQIYFLFEKITMAGNSFNTNIIIMRSLLNTAGCLFFLSATYSIVTIYQRSKFLHSVSIALCFLGIVFVLSNLAWWIAVDAEGFNSNLSNKNDYQPFQDSVYYSDSTLGGGFQMNINGAWNNLFVKLKCCGYLYGNDGDFGRITFQDSSGSRAYDDRTSLFCCHSNPLTQNYNPSYENCTTPAGSSHRYTESCSGKLSKKLQKYSIAFCIMAVLAIVSQITLIVVLRKMMKRDPPLREDFVLLKLKSCFRSDRRQRKPVVKQEEHLDLSINDKTHKSLDKSISQISAMSNSYNSAHFEESQGGLLLEKSNKKRGRRRGNKVHPEAKGEVSRQGPTTLPPLKKPQYSI